LYKNKSNINNNYNILLIKSTLSSTDSSQDITQPPTKRLRAANGVQYSPVITNNTMQSPVLTTQQQQNLNINTSPVMTNGLLNDLSTTQLLNNNWTSTNKQLINQQIQNTQLIKRQQQIQQQQIQQLQLQQQQELQKQQQQQQQLNIYDLKNSKAQLQYNLKLKQQQQSQNSLLSTTNPTLTSPTLVNFPSTKPSINHINTTTTVATTNNIVDSANNGAISAKSSTPNDLKRKSSIPSSHDNSSNAKTTTDTTQNLLTTDKTKDNKTNIPSNQTPTTIEQQQLSLFQNNSNESLNQLLQNNYSINDTEMFNKGMEILLNFQQSLIPFDNEHKNADKINTTGVVFDSINPYSNKINKLDEDPEKMFSLPVESVFYAASNTSDLVNDKQNLNYIDKKQVKILTPIASLQEHKQKISACCFDNSGKTLASGSNDNRIIVWDVSNTNGKCKPVWTLGGHKKSVNIVRYCNLTGIVGNAISKSNSDVIINSIPTLLVTGSIDKTVRIWKLNGIKHGIINEKKPFEMISIFEDHNWGVTAADFCPIGVCNSQNVDGFGEAGKKIMIYCGSLDAEGELKIWNVMNKKILKSVKLNKSPQFEFLTNPLRFKPINKGSFLISDSTIVTLVAAYATSLIVIDFLLPQSSTCDENSDDYTIRTKGTEHKKYITSLEWADDGHHLLTASEDMIYVWNIDVNNEFQMIYSIPSEDEKITSCIFLPSPYILLNSSANSVNNLRIAYSTYDNDNIYIWESDNTGKSSYNHYSSSNTGKISTYNKAHTGTICSLSSCIRLKSSVKSITKNTTNDDFEIILASSSSTKENNLKLWNVNI